MAATARDGRTFWTAAVTIIVLDVVTKALVVRSLFPHIPREVFGQYGRLTLAYNPGAAFGMSLGDASRYVFGGIKVAALIVLWQLYRRWMPRRETPRVAWMRMLALGLAFGGTAGNLIDRIKSPRGVVDFIDVGVGNVRFWTFNVADSALTIGALILAWVLWQDDREAAAQAAAVPDSPSVSPEHERVSH